MTPDPALPRGLRAADDSAIAQARVMLERLQTAALATLDPEDGAPVISQIAAQYLVGSERAQIVAFVSDLARHTRALDREPACALLIQEPQAKGDPMTWPRLMLRARARRAQLTQDADRHLRTQWSTRQPKATIWLGLADFHPWVFDLGEITLNAGFGKAFVISPRNLGL